MYLFMCHLIELHWKGYALDKENVARIPTQIRREDILGSKKLWFQFCSVGCLGGKKAGWRGTTTDCPPSSTKEEFWLSLRVQPFLYQQTILHYSSAPLTALDKTFQYRALMACSESSGSSLYSFGNGRLFSRRMLSFWVWEARIVVGNLDTGSKQPWKILPLCLQSSFLVRKWHSTCQLCSEGQWDDTGTGTFDMASDHFLKVNYVYLF